jgi:hypothetical protein
MRRPAHLTFLALASTLALACAPPTPGEEVRSSEDAVTSTSEARMVFANIAYDPSFGGINENVRFDRGGQGVLVCRAFANGTPAQASACDDFPTGYTKMPCVDLVNNQTPEATGRLFTDCGAGGRFGQAPYDKGDGAYRVTFVSEKSPNVRATREVRLTSDFFSAFVLGSDIMNTGTAFDQSLFGIAENAPVALRGGLHLTLQLKRDLAPSIKGCVAAYSSEGMAADDIAARDREEIAGCAQPNVPLDGRDGWKRTDGRPFPDRSQLEFDATPFLTPKLRLVFAFEVGGRVRSYIFQN